MFTVSFIFYIYTYLCLFLTFGSQIIRSVSQWAQCWTRPTFQLWKHHKVINSVGFKGQSNRNRSLDVTWIHAKVLSRYTMQDDYRTNFTTHKKNVFFPPPKSDFVITVESHKLCQEHVRNTKEVPHKFNLACRTFWQKLCANVFMALHDIVRCFSQPNSFTAALM